MTLLPLASLLSEHWDSGREGGNALGDGVSGQGGDRPEQTAAGFAERHQTHGPGRGR